MSLKKLFDPANKELKKSYKVADAVLAKADEYKALSDDDLKQKTVYFREQLKNGVSLDNIMVDAFATAREASRRVLGLYPFRVQVVGAAAMHFGNIAEMKTGEGKTLTSVMVAYLNALSGEGVHIVTVNEYLATRDCHDMGQVHSFLGLTVGLNLRDLSSAEKKAQYNCDITYSTNNELGFDYLRDHMVLYKEEMVQRPVLNFAIVDEVDSILIDEARTPLIISGGQKQGPNLYEQANTLCRRFKEEDYEIDIKDKTISLLPSGIDKAEQFFHLDNLYDIKNVTILHHINNALRANFIMIRDKDYVVQDNQIIIVDPFTGRLMHGRQWSDGLHQAIEAFNGVEVKKETRTLATITFQNYFRMYKKLSGMTGTAKTEEEEFRNIYNMLVVEIPTNVPVIRLDEPDLIYISLEAKYKAIIEDIKERHNLGQPVLMGTVAVETSELLSNMLKKAGIPHSVLNAKQHEREADIIAHAGEAGAVTIATNMAGRGTDIKLGPGVKELGGLAVIGTERHEARRIDNQLRGRSGRQGDPGYSRFYLSTKDELLVRFGGERFERVIAMLGKDKEGNEIPLESKMFSNFVESAQKKVEGSNYDRRKSVVEYDEVLRKQREIIYEQRKQVLFLDDIEPVIQKLMKNCVERNVPTFADDDKKHVGGKGVSEIRFMNEFVNKYFNNGDIEFTEIQDKTVDELIDLMLEQLNKNLAMKKEAYPEAIYEEFLKATLLRIVDTFWMDHIDQMSSLRQSVGLKSYGQQNPLREYQEVSFSMFSQLIQNIEDTVTFNVSRQRIREDLRREAVAQIVGTSGGSSEDSNKKKPIQNTTKKVGRNDPCPCGSGLKYKYCCGRNKQ